MEDLPSPIDQYILRLTAKERPRICFIPTPSGDLPDHIEKFYAAFDAECCQPSHLSFFRMPMADPVPLADFERHLLAQDVIFVGPGNTRSALAVWRDRGVDKALAKAYLAGVLLSGMSAGAMCWFEFGLTDTFWDPGYRPLPCLGLLPGGCGVHYNPNRKARLFAAVEAKVVPPSVVIDDFAALLYREGELACAVSWKSGAGAYCVSLHDEGAEETPYAIERIG
jgi:peptidase E